MNKKTNLSAQLFSPEFLILIIVCAFFTWTQYEMLQSATFSVDLIRNFPTYQGLMKFPWWIATFYFSELGGTVGGILRWIASYLALYSAFLYWRGKDAAIPQIKGKICTAILLEAGYFLFLIPTVWLGFVFPSTGGNVWYFEATPVLEVFFAAGLTSLMVVLVIPPILLKLRALILRNSPRQDIIKWSCITAVSYLFAVFWFNTTMQWLGMLTTFGVTMLLDPLNLAGFTASVICLFLVAIYALKLTFPAIKRQSVKLNPNRIGATAIAFGSYTIFGILVYFIAGGFAQRPFAWYELIVPHNPYLWCLIFLFAGMPLLFSRKPNDEKDKQHRAQISPDAQRRAKLTCIQTQIRLEDSL